MRQRNITRQRLNYLLANWGYWEAATSIGPKVSMLCGSAERAYAKDTSRHVWGGAEYVPRETPDNLQPVLAEKTESVLLKLSDQYQRVIVLRYARNLVPEQIAARLCMSRVMAEAILDAAIVAAWSELEDMTWARGL